MTRTIFDVLEDLKGGACVAEMEAELKKVVAGVFEHDKAGTVTLKLAIKPMKGCCVVEHTVSSKVPEPDKATLFFPTAEGDLLRDHPAQRTIDDAINEARVKGDD